MEDEIKQKYTEDELRAELSRFDAEYRPIYINIKDYLDKPTKFAFRYYGRAGAPTAIDNIAVGVPQPVAKYVVPNGFFFEGVSPNFDYPSEPKMMIPFGTEALGPTSQQTYSEANGIMPTQAGRQPSGTKRRSSPRLMSVCRPWTRPSSQATLKAAHQSHTLCATPRCRRAAY